MAENEQPQINRIGDHALAYFRRFVNEDKSGLDYEAIAAQGFNEKQIENIKLGVEQAGWFEKPKAALRGALPDDFPHAKALKDAGHDTYGKVRKLVAKGDDWFISVPGIGDKKAPDVVAAIGAKPESEDEG